MCAFTHKWTDVGTAGLFAGRGARGPGLMERAQKVAIAQNYDFRAPVFACLTGPWHDGSDMLRNSAGWLFNSKCTTIASFGK